MSKTYFISYNKNDVAWAEWIAWLVEDLGDKVIIQAWDFTPGKSWTQEMHNAVKNADSTICVLSNDFLKSDFTAAEWQTAFADDPLGEKRKIIPIKVKDCKPDGLLKNRIYADLVGKDKSTAKSAVKQALLDGRRKPRGEPVFPPDHGSEPSFPKKLTQYAFVIDGAYDEESKAKVEALIKHLQKVVNDTSLTTTEITKGSVILHLQSSYDSFRQLQNEFLKDDGLCIGDTRILGIWQLSESTSNPVDQRLKYYSDRLIKFFISQGVDKETSKDLSQDVIINLYTAQNMYKYLSSTALTINLARIALSKSIDEKNIDALIRKKYVNPTGDIDWNEVYRTSLKVFGELAQDDRFILEQYWDSKFAEGKFDHLVEEEKAVAIDEFVQSYINITLDDN